MVYAVRWTCRNGRVSEFHFGRRDVAEEVAEGFRRGWRKDARVVEL